MSTVSENSVTAPSDEPIPGLGPIVFAVFAVALAGLLFGYDTGVASGIQVSADVQDEKIHPIDRRNARGDGQLKQ